MEAVLVPLEHSERWRLIDEVIGESSPFHEEFGYYAGGVEIGTAVLPQGWRHRLVSICNENTRGIAGLCLQGVCSDSGSWGSCTGAPMTLPCQPPRRLSNPRPGLSRSYRPTCSPSHCYRGSVGRKPTRLG